MTRVGRPSLRSGNHDLLFRERKMPRKKSAPAVRARAARNISLETTAHQVQITICDRRYRIRGLERT